MTSNQAESFNALLKRLQNWREVPVDAIVLSLYYLQAFYSNEVQRGFAGLGNFKLSAEFAAAQRAADEIITISTYQPEEIVNRIQGKKCIDVTMEDSHMAENDPPAEISSASSSTQHARAR